MSAHFSEKINLCIAFSVAVKRPSGNIKAGQADVFRYLQRMIWFRPLYYWLSSWFWFLFIAYPLNFSCLSAKLEAREPNLTWMWGIIARFISSITWLTAEPGNDEDHGSHPLLSREAILAANELPTRPKGLHSLMVMKVDFFNTLTIIFIFWPP